MNSDWPTAVLHKALNVLFCSNPQGTSLGIISGVVVDAFLSLFSPVLRAIEFMNFGAVRLWHLIALGVFAFNVRSYARRNRVDPKIESALEFIQQRRAKGEISELEYRQELRKLIRRVLESVTLRPEDQEQRRELELAANTGQDDDDT